MEFEARWAGCSANADLEEGNGKLAVNGTFLQKGTASLFSGTGVLRHGISGSDGLFWHATKISKDGLKIHE